jgi:hypothetical protein
MQLTWPPVTRVRLSSLTAIAPRLTTSSSHPTPVQLQLDTTSTHQNTDAAFERPAYQRHLCALPTFLCHECQRRLLQHHWMPDRQRPSRSAHSKGNTHTLNAGHSNKQSTYIPQQHIRKAHSENRHGPSGSKGPDCGHFSCGLRKARGPNIALHQMQDIRSIITQQSSLGTKAHNSVAASTLGFATSTSSMANSPWEEAAGLPPDDTCAQLDAN